MGAIVVHMFPASEADNMGQETSLSLQNQRYSSFRRNQIVIMTLLIIFIFILKF